MFEEFRLYCTAQADTCSLALFAGGKANIRTRIAAQRILCRSKANQKINTTPISLACFTCIVGKVPT
jgi:hypothetical protein